MPYDSSELAPPVWDKFSYTWVCVIIFILEFAMTAPRDVTIFVKANSIGGIFIPLVGAFLVGEGIYGMTNTTYTTNKK